MVLRPRGFPYKLGKAAAFPDRRRELYRIEFERQPYQFHSAANWAAEGWLQTEATTAGTVQFTTASAALQQGAYYALIRVISSDVFNSPQDFVVVLNVTDAAGTSRA